MPDDIDVDDPAGDPPAPTPKPKPAPKPDPVDPEDLSPEEQAAQYRKMQKALKDANAEAQKGREARKRLQELEEEKERLEQEKLTENEKRDRRAAAAEARLKDAEEKAAKLERENLQMRIDDAVKTEVDAQGLSPYRDLIADAIRGKRDNGIAIDEETQRVIGVKDAVKKYVASFPELATGGIGRNRGTPVRESNPRAVPPRDGRPQQPQQPVVDVDLIDRSDLQGKIGYGL